MPKASLPVNPQASQNATVAKLHTVKITSPAKGQQIPAAKNLTVSGITTDGASHCQVSVIVNGVKPYQPATGAGPRGPADYSKWNFVLTSKYTTIKLGPNNKITAKYSCSNPKGISFYSVTVTGVGAPTTPSVNATSTNNAPILRNTVANNVVSTRGISATSASDATGTNNAALLANGNTGAAHNVGFMHPLEVFLQWLKVDPLEVFLQWLKVDPLEVFLQWLKVDPLEVFLQWLMVYIVNYLKP